ncbi:peptidoglycan-binding protein [Reyranella sp.]|uniref:peptidoglycan-binding protein n=1 Tax=Reyranella sp. TaxID=1929291 RepID=UPI003BAD08F2
MRRSLLIIGTAAGVVAAVSTAAWLDIPHGEPPPAMPISTPVPEPAARSAAAPTPAPAPSVPAPASEAAPVAATDPAASASAVATTAPGAGTPPQPLDVPTAALPPEPTTADFAASGAEPTGDLASGVDWSIVALEELRTRAGRDEMPAMEELARRLIQGVGVPKDQQAGAGWLLRAAQRGSAQAAFNVGVMYERGFVVERDSTKAVEWYRKAVEGDIPAAKHNLALLLRDGKGAPRDGAAAVELLQSAARQGMAASMFTLGDIHERGDAGVKDQAVALAWFAITAEFERQTNRGSESALGKTAAQRVEILQRILLPADLERAQKIGQSEFRKIVEALQPPKPAEPPPTGTAAAPPATPEPESGPPGWPREASEQIRVVQQALIDLGFLRDKADGAMGPLTRSAIRAFQKSAALRETGEPTRDVFASLQAALASREAAAKTPRPEAEPRSETPGIPAPAEAAQAPAPPAVDLGTVEPAPPPPTSADFQAPVAAPAAAAEATPAATAFSLPAPEAPPPPTSRDLVQAAATPDPDGWPASPVDQIKVVQGLLRDLKFVQDPPDGVMGPVTEKAIRDYEQSAGLAPTGEANRALFDSLKRALAARPN